MGGQEGKVVKVYDHQFTEDELDYLIQQLRLDADAGSKEICQQVLENLEETRKEGPSFEVGEDKHPKHRRSK